VVAEHAGPDKGTAVDAVPSKELRSDYHDRVATVRGESLAIVGVAVAATRDATVALLDPDATAEKLAAIETATRSAPVDQVEAEVLELLALESPVARDLRIILTSRDVAQIGELCLGLCLTLATRARRAREVLSGDLRVMVGAIGEQTADLLNQAYGAWAGIDDEWAAKLIGQARTARDSRMQFFTELVGLREVPVHAAIDLGLAVRVFERLADHAVDIAGRVIFAATGTPPVRATQNTEA
jgi:phosphate transport system protein